MEAKINSIEPLLEKAEVYGKTGYELIKLRSLDKTADLASTLASRSMFTLVVSFFAFALNIAVALWLGDLLGKAYYGFLIVASCYALAGVVLLIIHPFIKSRVNNAVIKQLFR